MPAFDYYQEEAVVKLIEGVWKWQEHFSLGKQLEKIAANLITKQRERYQRTHPWVENREFEIKDSDENEDDNEKSLNTDGFARRTPQFIEVVDPERLPDTMDDDGQEELDETYEMVFQLVADDEELTLYVQAIQVCNSFQDLPDKLGISIKRVYRLQEKLMRRIRRHKVQG